MSSAAITAEDVAKTLSYIADTGAFIRTKGAGNGKPAFLRETYKGYLKVQVCGKRMFAHRLAWLMHYGEWPDCLVDHVNGDRKDNRIKNLRLADASQNAANAKIYKTNTSGFKGVSERSPGKFRAYVYKDKKMIRLGQYPSAELAYAAHVAAAQAVHGEFFRPT